MYVNSPYFSKNSDISNLPFNNIGVPENQTKMKTSVSQSLLANYFKLLMSNSTITQL